MSIIYRIAGHMTSDEADALERALVEVNVWTIGNIMIRAYYRAIQVAKHEAKKCIAP